MTRTGIILVALIALAGVAAGGWRYWQSVEATRLPDGITSANGRVEATEVDVATKLPGRIIEIVPREGDMIEAGAIVAKLDAGEFEAQVRQSEADVQRTRGALAASQSAADGLGAELRFAQQEFDRTSVLTRKGFAPTERLDHAQHELSTATAAYKSAQARVDEAAAAVKSAEASADHMKSQLGDTTITSPVRGRVQYRLVEQGGVLPAGGKIVTLLDLSDVTMTIFLPALDAGRLTIGDEARVVLDAASDYVFPSTVAFVSPEAQFTPKTVETATEREKLMFRVKLKAPPDLLKKFENEIKSGLRGIAYVRTSQKAQWPGRLAVKLPER